MGSVKIPGNEVQCAPVAPHVTRQLTFPTSGTLIRARHWRLRHWQPLRVINAGGGLCWLATTLGDFAMPWAYIVAPTREAAAEALVDAWAAEGSPDDADGLSIAPVDPTAGLRDQCFSLPIDYRVDNKIPTPLARWWEDSRVPSSRDDAKMLAVAA